MKSDFESSPEFNSGIDYLKRIGWLMQYAHFGASNDDDYADWLAVLEQLHIELSPRFTPDELVEVEGLRLDAVKFVTVKDKVRAYHFRLNILAHSHGLIMRDVSGLPGVLQQ